MIMARVQFELSREKNEELEALMKRTGIRTKKDLINNALTIFEWAVNERARGRIIASVDEEEKKYKEILMPVLEHVARKKKEAATA
jgi:hypothetical protein